MSRLALPADVRLTFDPTMSATALTNNSFLGTADDQEAVDSIVQNAESGFYQQVDSAFRLDERRNPEVHEVMRSGHRAYRAAFAHVGTRYTEGPVEVVLNHGRVFPFDTNESPDQLEVRTGMADWKDITDGEGDEWDLVDPSGGILLVEIGEVFRNEGVTIDHNIDKVWVRAKYRYGSKGGDIRVGGQTTLAGPIAASGSDTGVSVTDASRLPPAPAVLLVFDPTDPLGTAEYVRVTAVDTSADTIDVTGRGERLTAEQAHSTDDVVHYAPLFVREAVAKKAAIDLTQADDYSEWLPDTEIPLPAPRKLDEWRNDWREAIDLLS